MKRFIMIVMLFTLLAFMLPACQAVTNPAAAITIKDGLDREVKLAGPAQKIISLSASNTEILYAIGAGKQVIGRDSFSDYPEEANAVADIGGDMGKYNLEEITKLQPDLVLAAGINTPEQVKALEDLKITVFYLANPKTLEDMFTNLQTVARLTGHEQETDKLVNTLRTRVDSVDKALANGTTRSKVYYELDATDPSKPYTAGPGTFVDLLIKRAGGENIGANLKTEWAQISLEELIIQNPDIVILGDSAYGTTPEQVSQRPGWEAIKAVQNNRILPFNDDLVTLPGPRLVDGLVELAKSIHPELAGQLQ